MSNHPTIAALRAALESERAWQEFKEANPPKGQAQFYYKDNAEYFKSGHEAATERLMPMLEQAIEVMYQIGLARCPSYMAHPQSVWFDEHVQSKAREFLSTLADASGDK